MNIKYFIGLSSIIILSIINCSDKSNPTMPQDINNNSIGTISLNLPGTIVNNSTLVNISVKINPGILLIDSILTLNLIDESGNIISELTYLHDDGSSYHNDDISGDNVFNQVLNINEKNPKIMSLSCFAKYENDGKIIDGRTDITQFTIYEDITQNDISQIHNTQREGINKLQEFYEANGGNDADAIQKLVSWLLNLSHVDSVQSDGFTSIGIKYKSGMQGGIILSETDVNGKITTKGGIIDTSLNRRMLTPPRKQTVGVSKKNLNLLNRKTFKTDAIEPNLIGNRKALIYAPFKSQFSRDHGPSITSILNDSDLDFEITLLEDSKADVAVLNDITDYGLIIISSHGNSIPQQMFATGEIADTNAATISPFYKTLLRGGQLSVMTLGQKNLLGWDKNVHDYWGITPLYFAYHTQFRHFPNSVIIFSACFSNATRDFSRVLLNSGAKAYFGFDNVAGCNFAVQVIDTLVKRLTNQLKNVGESFIPNQKDPENIFTVFEMESKNNDLHYPLKLINGDFEYGVLDGWNKSGDGRIITKLGNFNSYEGSFMGIISTGLGKTLATGSLTQTIKIEKNQKLTLKWNYLSEEFLEFIGTTFQDYFQVAIKTKDGTNNLILVKTIDDIAQEFGASKDPLNAGSLISVTPPIDFGNHGVYMTDWQTFTYDLSSYEDQIVTLVLAVGDVGDSSYDTAILLDLVSID